jgi:hypothetical protein
MQKGVNLWDAAGFLGMTAQQLEQGYGHHHPDYRQEAVAALGGEHGALNETPSLTAGITSSTCKTTGTAPRCRPKGVFYWLRFEIAPIPVTFAAVRRVGVAGSNPATPTSFLRKK